jgi:hypothetical protein
LRKKLLVKNNTWTQASRNQGTGKRTGKNVGPDGRVGAVPWKCWSPSSVMAEGDVHLEGVWISEPKLDDERIITLCKGDQIDLWTRRYVEVSYELP